MSQSLRAMASLNEIEVRLEQLMPLIEQTLSEGKSVTFSPRGTSMLPMLRQKIDSVVLSPLPPRLKKYDLPLYRRDDGKYVLHRVIGVGESYTCIGDNQFLLEPGVKHEQVLALVTAFYRGDRKWKVSSPTYRAYCVIWHYSRPLRHFWRRGMGWLRRHLG